MNTKLTFVAYPAIAILSLVAAFAAHAQSANDPVDQAGYGATQSNTASVYSRAEVRSQAVVAARSALLGDALDRSGYGPTFAPSTSQRTRAEVRAEAIAARDAGYDLLYREGGDVQFAAMHRAKAVDASHVVASAPAKSNAQ